MGKKISFLKRELRLSVGDQKAFNKEHRIVKKIGKAKEKRLRALLKKELQGRFN